jgi:glycosyltransferase involved in cell wall biosynthesis
MSFHVGYVLKMYPRFSETFIVNEILELERRGARVTVFSLRVPREGRFHEKISRVAAEVVYLPNRSVHELVNLVAEQRDQLAPTKRVLSSYLWEQIEGDGPLSLAYVSKAIDVAAEVRARGIQHLHAHFATSATAVARMASRLACIPYSFTAHAKDIYLETHSLDRLRRFMADASFVVTVCDANCTPLARIGRGRGDVRRIYNGLDLEEFRPAPAARSARFTILGVGRLIPKKGFDTLVESCRLLKKRGLDFQCRIAGTGPDEEDLAARIRRDETGDMVELAGPLPNERVRAEISAADVVALPARVAEDGNRDALPTVLLEAMALETPFVSTPVTGIPEIAGANETGLLVPPDRPDLLADVLASLAESPGLRQSLGRAGRSRVRNLFDVRHSVSELLRLFETSGGRVGSTREFAAAATGTG